MACAAVNNTTASHFAWSELNPCACAESSFYFFFCSCSVLQPPPWHDGSAVNLYEFQITTKIPFPFSPLSQHPGFEATEWRLLGGQLPRRKLDKGPTTRALCLGSVHEHRPWCGRSMTSEKYSLSESKSPGPRLGGVDWRTPVAPGNEPRTTLARDIAPVSSQQVAVPALLYSHEGHDTTVRTLSFISRPRCLYAHFPTKLTAVEWRACFLGGKPAQRRRLAQYHEGASK